MREKQAILEFVGQQYGLLYNVAAMDAIYNRYGGAQQFVDKLEEDPETFCLIDLPWVLELLMNQSIDLYNYEHNAQKEKVDSVWVQKLCVYTDDPMIREKFCEAISDAITLGNDGIPLQDEEEEVDVILEQIEKEKGTPKRTIRPLHLLFMGLQCGLTERECWLATPGKILELWHYKVNHELMLRGGGLSVS